MSVAVIYTGQMRTFDKCIKTHFWHVFRRFADCHFFVSTVKDGDEHKAGLLREYSPNVTVDVVDAQPDFPELKPWSPGQFYSHEPFAISVPPIAVLRQLWQLEQGYRLFQKSGLKPDLVIRIRPDIYFHSLYLEIPSEYMFGTHVPWWGCFGGVNDRFAIMSPIAAAMYFTAYSNREKLWNVHHCPFHPESMIYGNLTVHGHAVSRKLQALFSTLRVNGEMRGPEISAWDIANCAL